MAAATATATNTEKIDAFFKMFEIPELHNMHLLRKDDVEWQTMEKPPMYSLPNMHRLLYRSVSDTKDYLILVSADKGIDRFDIATNEMVHLTDYPDNFQCWGADSTINPNNGDVYIIGGDAHCFGVFNVEEKEWDIKCLNKIDDAEKDEVYDLTSKTNDPKVIDDVLYVVGWSNNRYYDPAADAFVRVVGTNNTTESAPTSGAETKLCFNARWNTYIQFGSIQSYSMFKDDLNDEIWTFSKERESEESNEDKNVLWNMTEIKLPPVHSEMSLKYALTVDDIACLIYFPKDVVGKTDEAQVWSHNLGDGNMKWFKSRIDFGGNIGDIAWDAFDIVMTEDGVIHRISFEHGVHHKTTLAQIVDQKLFGLFKRKYNHLVHGFIKGADMIGAADLEKVDVSDVA